MRTSFSIIFTGVTLLLNSSCDWLTRTSPCEASGPVIVYKTKNDYTNNIWVQLSKDGKEITARPGPTDVIHQTPIKLENGYLLKRMLGDAILSITIEEYTDPAFDWESKDLIEYVIETDPYSEKYECCEGTNGDTALINNLIRENRLGECEDIK
jgi:hypothetical protein